MIRIIYTLTLLNMISFSSCAQGISRNMFLFESQAEIDKWSKKEFGTAPNSQMLDVGQYSIYVLFGEYARLFKFKRLIVS